MKFFLGLVFGLAFGAVVAGSFAVMNPLPDRQVAAEAAAPVPAPQPAVIPDAASEPAAAPTPQPAPAPEAAPEPAPAPEPSPQPAPADQQGSLAPAAPAAPSLGAPEVGESASASIGGGADAAPARNAAATPQVGAPDAVGAAPRLDTSAAAVPQVGGEVPGSGTALVSGNALQDNAASFDGDRGKPLMAIILIDDGSEPALRAGLTALSSPITFGVSADLAGVEAVASTYRESGFEVVAVLPQSGPLALSADTDPAAVPSVLARVFAAVPVATALMDPIDGPMPSARRLTDAVLDGLKITGHGLLTHRGTGLNNVPLIADEAGVHSEVIFRQIDDTPDAAAIALALERAALDASRGGSVIVVGYLRQETVSTLFSWLLGSGTREVTVAPVSALLL